jgi:homoserine O-acetyltransferase/O-succinyltransferase
MGAQTHEFGRVELQHGGVLANAQLTYTTFGTLASDGANAVLFPTWFTGQHPQVEWLIGADRALDPRKYFIVVVNILGNGQSSSPSNTAPPYDRARFPHTSILDNVQLQRRLLWDVLGVRHLTLVVGRSMGAQLAFQWGSYFADDVDRILPICGSARTSPHNYVFLASVKAALTNDPSWQGGEYNFPPFQGLRMLRLIYDGWVVSQNFYRAGLHLQQGFGGTQDYLDRPDVGPRRDANDLLAQLWTWQHADISANHKFNGDFPAALRAITARALVMPCRHDLYFPPEDSAIEVSHMPAAELRVIESVWGHRAGSPGSDPKDIALLDKSIADLLAR